MFFSATSERVSLNGETGSLQLELMNGNDMKAIDILLQSTQKKIQGSGVCVVCNKNELSNELVR